MRAAEAIVLRIATWEFNLKSFLYAI